MSCNIRLCMSFNDIWRIKLYIPPSELKHVLDFLILDVSCHSRILTNLRRVARDGGSIKCAVRRFPKQTKSCFSNLEYGWFHESEHVRRGLCLSHYVLHICYITQPAGPAGRTCTRYMIVLSFFISGVVVVRVYLHAVTCRAGPAPLMARTGNGRAHVHGPRVVHASIGRSGHQGQGIPVDRVCHVRTGHACYVLSRYLHSTICMAHALHYYVAGHSTTTKMWQLDHCTSQIIRKSALMEKD
jgi:hypothetical protein